MNIDNLKTARPKKVTDAVRIIYVTLGIGVLRSGLEATANSERTGVTVGFLMFATLGIMAIATWIILMIGRRRNWARITFLILFLSGLIPSLQMLTTSFAINPVSGLLGIGQVVLQAIALVYLFHKDASDWFRHKSTRASV
jgi:hypothetical protein